MAPKSCKKPVYATMCETEDGRRIGKYRGNRYESHRKKTATKTTKVKTVRKTPAKIKKAVPIGFDDPRTAYDMAADRRLDDLEAMEFMVNRNRLNTGRKSDDEIMLQKMYLQDAWMKRQASRRKKYGTAAKTVPVSSAPAKKKRSPLVKYKVFFMKHDTDFGRYVKKKAHSIDELRGQIIASTIGQSYNKTVWVVSAEDNKWVGQMRYNPHKNRYEWTSKEEWTDMKGLNKDGTEVRA